MMKGYKKAAEVPFRTARALLHGMSGSVGGFVEDRDFEPEAEVDYGRIRPSEAGVYLNGGSDVLIKFADYAVLGDFPKGQEGLLYSFSSGLDCNNPCRGACPGCERDVVLVPSGAYSD